MRLFMALLLVTSTLLPLTAFAEIKTVTHTLRQPFGGSQSPDDARTAGIARAKREALEQFGTYIESTTVVKESKVASDEILALTAGVTKVEVVNQKNYTDGDAFGIEITVKIELDTDVLDKSLAKLLEDRHLLKMLTEARDHEKMLLARIVELERIDKKGEKTEKQLNDLKKGFREASQGLTAIEWFNKAMEFFNYNPNKTVEFLTEAIRLDPNYVAAYFMRGGAYTNIQMIDQAISDYDHAILLDPNNYSYYRSRGLLYSYLKQYDRAISDYTQAIQMKSDGTGSQDYNFRGKAYADLGKYDQAIDDYSHVITTDSNNVSAYTNRGATYQNLKKYDLAIADYDQALKLDPYDVIAYSNRAKVYFSLKQNNKAIEDFDKAISLNPNDADTFRLRGVVKYELKQYYKAIMDFDEAIRLDPNDAVAYDSRGYAYMKIEKWDKVIDNYSQSIELNPNRARAYFMRGTAYYVIGDHSKACFDHKKACVMGMCDSYLINNNLCQ